MIFLLIHAISFNSYLAMSNSGEGSSVLLFAKAASVVEEKRILFNGPRHSKKASINNFHAIPAA